MDKIIFLDFDGVMDTAYYNHYLVKNGLNETDEYGCFFDSNCIKNLYNIIERTGASIVISSSWKNFFTIEQIRQMWQDRELPGDVIDVTPTVGKRRGDDIDAWLEKYGKPCQYVVFDDVSSSNFNSHQLDYFIEINPYKGLDEKDAERAISILNGSYIHKNMHSKKILIIPDVHGRKFWRNPMKHIEDYEHVVFLGDYLDPYEDFEFISIEDAFDEFMKILDMKVKHPEKVTLLLGNHDLHYLWHEDMDCSRRCEEHLQLLHSVYSNLLLLFSLVFEVNTNDRKYIFSHAGILPKWLQDNHIKYDNNELNNLLLADNFGILAQVSLYRGGWDTYGSPVWADVREHLACKEILPGAYQIFGHTLMDNPVIEKHWACLDCCQAFTLDLENNIIESLT